MKYSQWLEQEFIPFYECESLKKREITGASFSYTKLIYICPILMIYRSTKVSKKHLKYAKVLQDQINLLIQEEKKKKGYEEVSTLSDLIGYTRADRIKWLLSEVEEAKMMESIQECHNYVNC